MHNSTYLEVVIRGDAFSSYNIAWAIGLANQRYVLEAIEDQPTCGPPWSSLMELIHFFASSHTMELQLERYTFCFDARPRTNTLQSAGEECIGLCFIVR